MDGKAAGQSVGRTSEDRKGPHREFSLDPGGRSMSGAGSHSLWGGWQRRALR